jgi:hypothetical protein
MKYFSFFYLFNFECSFESFMNNDLITSFWTWTQENIFQTGSTKHCLEQFRTNPDLLKQITSQLQRIDPDLVPYLQIDPQVTIDEPGSLQLIISPSGHPDLLSVSQAIVSASPLTDILPTLTCRPKAEVIPTLINIEGKEYPLDTFVAILREGRGLVNLTIGIPSYISGCDEQYSEVVFNILDILLGEQDVITKVGDLSFCPVGELLRGESAAKVITLIELPEHFSHFVSELSTTLLARQSLSLPERVSESFRRTRTKLANEISLALDEQDVGAKKNVCEVVFLGTSEDAATELQNILKSQLGGVSEVTTIYTLLGPSLSLSHSFLLESLNGTEVFRTINELALRAGEHSFDLCDVQVVSK